MERPKIIRLWGNADDFDIEFKNEGGIWKVDVPPDFTDGVYAVTLHALNEFYESATWVGELFMCNGACCIKIHFAPYQVWFKVKEYSMSFFENYEIELRKSVGSAYIVVFDTSNFDILIRKGCGNDCNRN